MILLPIRTDTPVRRTPWVNYGLIAVNVAVFLLTGSLLARSVGALALRDNLMLWPDGPRWYQFLSSMFLHGGWVHLVGNMLFLWVFGNSLNNKLGNGVYLMFYLASGLFAGAGYVLFQSMPVVGASGAIFGVVAGFLVLFPSSRVTTFYWFFFFFGFLDLSGLTVVGYFLALNIFYLMAGAETGVAYLAHLSGAAFGFAAALVLLASSAVGRDQFDLLAMFRRWNQRRGFRDYMSDPARQAEARFGRVARAADSPLPDSASAEDPLTQLRIATVRALQAGDAAAAGRLYAQLRSRDPGAVLPPGQQRDLGNYLMSDGQHALAAEAYEALLARYPTFESPEQIELLLGLLYGRYLANPVRARRYLQTCLPRLRDPNQQALCREALAHVAATLGE